MTNQYPFIPPPELVQQWHDDWLKAKVKHVNFDEYISTTAARWGADQELEACCELIESFADFGDLLRAERRPKLTSLKSQALDALRTIETNIPQSLQAFEDSCEDIRRALEALPND